MGLGNLLSGWLEGRAKVDVALDAARVAVGGKVLGRVEVTGVRRSVVISALEVRLVQVRIRRETAPASDIVARLVADHVIAADVDMAPREQRSFPFAFAIPDGIVPSSASTGYRIEVRALFERRPTVDMRTELEVKAAAGADVDSLLVRWPALRGADEDALLDALRQLQWEHDPEHMETDFRGAAPLVARWISEGSPTVRRAALDAWSSIIEGRASEDDVALLDELARARDVDPALRRQLADAAGRLGERGLGVLRVLCRDPEPDVRRAVVTATRTLPPAEGGTLGLLDALADDPEPAVRAAVFRAYGAFDSDLDVIRRVAEHTEHEREPVVLEACLSTLRSGFYHEGADIARPVFDRSSRDERVEVREAVARALYFVQSDAESRPVVMRLLNDEAASVRAAAASELRSLGASGRPFADELERLAREDSDERVRAAAWSSIPAVLEEERAVRAIESLLEGEHASEPVLLGVVAGLKFLPGVSYARLLEQLARSEFEIVATRARAALDEDQD